MGIESTSYNIVYRRNQPQNKVVGRPGVIGFCGKVNGISDFKNISNLTNSNFNKDYQRAYTANSQIFKRQKGTFTKWFDNLPT